MYTLVIKASEYGCVRKCECYVFTRTPMFNTGQLRPLNVVRHPTIISESIAFGDDMDEMIEGSPDELCEEESGMPPEIPLGLNNEVCTVQLVHSEDQAAVIVGFQMLLEDQVVSTKRLYEYLNLGRFAAADVEVKCL